MSELLNSVQIEIIFTCIKCEESAKIKDGSIVLNSGSPKNDMTEIHGGDNVFYLSIVGFDHGIFRYTI